MTRSAIWFGRAMWLGILIDWALGIPAIVDPNWTLHLLRQPQSPNPQWVAFAAMLVIMLSFFYIPGAFDPYRYSVSAWLGVLARPPGSLFFLWLYLGQYPIFGLVDLGLFLIQFPLLVLTMRAAPRPDITAIGPPVDPRKQDVFEYDGSTFAEVREAVFSGVYAQLPFHRGLGLATMLQFINASARNLADKRDIRPCYDKLIHANGICYTGVWRIDQDSPYTGYFAKGSEGLVIARLSVAGPQLTHGHRRAFGIA